MSRYKTKEARVEKQTALINNFLSNGFILEQYKNIKIVHNLSSHRILVWTGSAALPSLNDGFYAGQKALDEKIASIKKHQDDIEENKAKRAVATGYSASVACVAKAIRAELKKAFSNVKFSVTSESFSMGNAVNVRWINGPTVEKVELITKKYQYGSTNSMEDIYEYSNVSKELPQAKYITTSRDISPEIKSRLLPQAEAMIPHEASTMLYRIMRRTEFAPDAEKGVLKLTERAGVNSGYIDERYEILLQA